MKGLKPSRFDAVKGALARASRPCWIAMVAPIDSNWNAGMRSVGGTDWNPERTTLQQMPESGSVQSVGGTY